MEEQARALTAKLTGYVYPFSMNSNNWIFFDFMKDFQGDPLRDWMRNHIEVPVIVVAFYMAMTLYVPQHVMASRPPFPLRRANQIWNLSLSIFSIFGAIYCVPAMVMVAFSPNYVTQSVEDPNVLEVRHGGIFNVMCDWNPRQFYDGPVGFFVALFILSKIPEMIDTLFLVFQKKPVLFLHWYHHITVMLYCWHAYTRKIAGGIIFAAMNYFVHSIMYFYYFICSCGGRRYVRPIAPLITFLQIAQMVVGGFYEFSAFYYVFGKRYTAADRLQGCKTDPTNARLGFFMYLTYFYLFVMLFKESYVDKKGTQRRQMVLSHSVPEPGADAATTAEKDAKTKKSN
ncbi:fatty acid elongase [Strigomonas culicis]|uniref:Elongation of fatty acids protein n=1 Tax=Strigomonas culicis TaxID=28005 RepID=S9W0C8_9TRYP|nr:fatty acid elongase [Strigomonas culicis]|eukprot:EPY29410.1 fatty acid elongase [Strigomonas culicis]